MPLAFSYVRFSSPEQAKGDSLQRQTEAAVAYCARKGLALDQKFNLRDLGVSAFKGANALTGNLGAFLKAIETGAVPAGSTLIIESFDRLSRQGVDEGMDLVKSILKSGVKIVTLKPEREFDRESVKRLAGTLEIQLILDRAMEESETKSKRCGDAWVRKKANARAKVLTRSTPLWIRAVGGDGRPVKETAPGEIRLELIPEKVAAVRRAFALAREGFGVERVAQKMNAEGYPVLGKPTVRGKVARWSFAVVHSLLTNRATFGEYQPHTGNGKGTPRLAAGPPVPNYYPAAINEEEFNAVRGVMLTRATVGRGRRGGRVSLFTGLMKDAHSGATVTVRNWRHAPSLIPSRTQENPTVAWHTFDCGAFETSLVAALAEVSHDDIAAGNPVRAKTEAVRAELLGLDALAAKWKAKMSNPDIVDAVAEKLAEIAGKRKPLAAELAKLEADAAADMNAAWKRSISVSADLASDDARERYRAAVRQVVDSIWVLVVPRPGGAGRHHYAAVQVWFKNGAHRDYLVAYVQGGPHRKNETLPWRSLASQGVPPADFRDPVQAKATADVLGRAIDATAAHKTRRERVKELHAQGMSTGRIAAAVGAHRTTVLHDYESLGLPVKCPKPTAGELAARRARAVELFDAGKSTAEIAAALGCHPTRAMFHLRAMGSGPPKRKSPVRRKA